ncbi:MAG: dinitrogenase iron-molybdenum cofactor biosynthesis domain-containing protein [Desulfobulbus propionicus]|nr:MAG: dinitrogenase iron-molybdenum cofactor biosynthesis domain-containing protein [Desulfobulbus propionicus]
MNTAPSPELIVAVTVWEDRVSPVFDTARTLLIAEITDAKISNTYYQPFTPEPVFQCIRVLQDQKVAALICGAVSRELADGLEAAGLEVIPFITGNIDVVLNNLVAGCQEWTPLKMPGCSRAVCCRGRMRHGGGQVQPPGDIIRQRKGRCRNR